MTTQPAITENSASLGGTITIVAAYVGKNPVPNGDLPTIIKAVYESLQGLNGSGSDAATNQKPAVPIKRSITPDHIICLEDGKKLKMLKRYLRTRYKMSPEDYRKKWGLPADYPIVAPNYAAQRSEFAKTIGLGKRQPAPKRRAKK